MHPFDNAIHLDPRPDGRLHGRTTPDYANMVGPFGGLIAACLLQAAMQHPERLGEPIALTANFAAAIADGAFTIMARPLRTNRSTQHWAIELEQDGQVAASATAVFAVRRATWSAPDAAPPIDSPRAETLARATSVDALAWTQRYDMRFVRGGMPAAFDAGEQDDSSSVVWLRDEPPRPLDHVALASLADCFFPRIFLRRRKRVPIGTVTLTTYFHADAAMLRQHDTRSVLGTARALNFRNGYFDQTATLWSDDGRQLASSHQMVYFRE